MSDLASFITKYSGQVVRGGQCGELVRQYWIDVDQTNPPSYENSKDYWFNDVPGYDKVASPQAGDIAIYNGHGAYPEGHSAIYVDGRVFEQNANPDGSPAHLYTRSNTYLLGYLRKQGEDMSGPGTADNYTVEALAVAILGRSAKDDQNLQNNIGRPVNDVIDTFRSYPEAKARAAKANAPAVVLKPGTYQVN